VEADAEATKRREASAMVGMGICCCRLAWMERVWSARARMEGGVGRRMEGAGKAVGGDCWRMVLMAASATLHCIAYGDPGQNRAPKPFVDA
jgi:hypothetical protein